MSDFLILLLTLIPVCLFVLGFLALAGLLIWFLYRQWRPKDEAAVAADQKAAHVELGEKRTALRPWTSEALTDLSTDWKAHWSRLGRAVNAHGTLRSLDQPKGPPWVAFVFKVRGARNPDGQLHAQTSEQAFDYRITPEGITVRVDEVPLGRVLPEGELLDPDGQRIGKAPRPGGLPARYRLGRVEVMHDDRSRTYPVTLAERVVARLANPRPVMEAVVSLKRREHAPVVTLAAEPVSERERTWLLALAILQIAYYNVIETIWVNQSI